MHGRLENVVCTTWSASCVNHQGQWGLRTCPTRKLISKTNSPVLVTKSINIFSKHAKNPYLITRVPGSGGTLIHSSREFKTWRASSPVCCQRIVKHCPMFTILLYYELGHIDSPQNYQTRVASRSCIEMASKQLTRYELRFPVFYRLQHLAEADSGGYAW